MSTHAIAPRLAAESRDESIESAIAAAARVVDASRCDLMPVLLRYWNQLPRVHATERRRWLESTRACVHRSETSPRAFVLHALGDHDEEIVHQATLEYAGRHPVIVERRQAAVEEAVDWIRRGLALNRGAVLAALLSIADRAVAEALGGLRLILERDEVEVVCRRAAQRRSRVTREFLAGWLELLDACEVPDTAVREIVAAALAQQTA